METLKHLGIVIVRGPKQSNHLHVVEKGMEFWNVEMFTQLDLKEVALVLAPQLEGIVHVAQCCLIMCAVLCQVDELEDGADCSDSVGIQEVNDTSQKNPTNVLPFSATNLTKGTDAILEVSNTNCRRKATNALVKFLLCH